MREEEFLPLPSAAMYILTVLASGPKHGYALMAEIRDLSDGAVRLGPGTLYGSLKRMIGQGLIVEAGARPDASADDERRRYYELTEFGARIFAAEHHRLAALVKASRKRVGAWPMPGTAT